MGGEFAQHIMIERDRRDVWWATPPQWWRKRAEPCGWTQNHRSKIGTFSERNSAHAL